MLNTSDYKHYWETVVDALACIYLYKNAATDEFKDQIRYENFPEAITRVRFAYYYCEVLPQIRFGLVGDEIDEFFSEMLIDEQRLDHGYSEALDCCCVSATPVPIRLL